MIELYPHTCTYRPVNGPDIYNQETGKWVPGNAGDEISVNCRAVPNGSGRKEKNQDGQFVDYEFDLAFPIDVNGLSAETEINIVDKHGNVIKSGRLLRFQAGQTLHSRGWV